MREFRRALLPVLCALVVLTPAFRAARPLPAELSDAEFWRLVSDSSEEGGGFLSENLVSNELGYPYVMPALIERVQRGGAYLGVGPEQNFTYIAAIRPSIAFIVDIRRQNMIEHLLYKAIFELSANRQEFLSRLFARKTGGHISGNETPEQLLSAVGAAAPDEPFYRSSLKAVTDLLVVRHGFGLTDEDKTTLEHVYQEFAKNGVETRYTVQGLRSATPAPITIFTADEFRLFGVTSPPPATTEALNSAALALASGAQFPSYSEVITAADPAGRSWSYLATEENYQAVRAFQQKNLIVPVVGDFAGPKAIQAVGRYLKDHDSSVAAFYVSNVEQYLTPAVKLQSFYMNVAVLPLIPSSTFIRSAQITGPQPGLAQSSLSPMKVALDAVLEGRAANWRDILRLPDGQ